MSSDEPLAGDQGAQQAPPAADATSDAQAPVKQRRYRLNPKVRDADAVARPAVAPSFVPNRPAAAAPESTAAEVGVATAPPAASGEHEPREVHEEPAVSTEVDAPANEPEPQIAAPESTPAGPAAGTNRGARSEDVRAAKTPVAIPKADIPLDEELAAQIDAAMAQADQTMPAAAIDPDAEPHAGALHAPVTLESLEPGAHLSGKIQSIHGDDVFLDLGVRLPGIVPKRQFVAGKKPAVGLIIEVIVNRINEEDGLILVDLPKGMRKVAGNWEAITKGQVIDCMVARTNKGGLEVSVGGLRGFLPAGQVDLHFVSDLEPFVGQKLRVEVIECNPKKRSLIVSRRAWLQVERQEREEELWKTLEIGQKFTGTVKTIKDFGAFVDLGGVDGFLHVGEISWTHIKHPSSILSEGQQVEVQIIGLNPESKKISLGMKQLTQDPWLAAPEKYAVGSTVSGTVTRTTKFGAFIELEPGIEGLVHISELDHQRVRRVEDVLKQGQSVEAKVLEVDPVRKRIGLSLKALKENPADVAAHPEAPAAQQPQRKRKTYLKGGTGESTGGGLFGNPRDYS